MNKEALIEEAKNLLVQTYDPQEIYVFGQFAWGMPDEESSMDLAVVVDHSDLSMIKRPVAGHLALAYLDVSKDILVYTQDEFRQSEEHPSSLVQVIKRKGRRIYAKA